MGLIRHPPPLYPLVQPRGAFLCTQMEPLRNPRLPVRNEYLGGWALTQNDTACLERLRGMGYTLPDHAPSAVSTPGLSAVPTSEGGSIEELWGETTRALMRRVDVVHDRDQRRLAASRYWQRLQVGFRDVVVSPEC